MLDSFHLCVWILLFDERDFLLQLELRSCISKIIGKLFLLVQILYKSSR